MSKKALPLVVGLVCIILIILMVFQMSKNQTPSILQENTTTRETAAQSTAFPTDINNQSGQNGPTPASSAVNPTLHQIFLTVSSPIDGFTINKATIEVKGTTIPGAEILVNDTETVADSQGNFSVAILLDEGENLIVVLANDQDGNSAEQELTVTYESAEI